MKTSTNRYYSVWVSEYSKKHFMKSFIKKYKTWDNTYKEIDNLLSRIDMFLLTTKINKIHTCDTWYIAKCEFKIVWSNESAKSSWNRIIVFVDEERKLCEILLIYAKTDIWGNNETTWWQEQIKCNHQEIYQLFWFK